MAVERGLGSPAKAVNRYSRLARKILTGSCSCIRNLWIDTRFSLNSLLLFGKM